MIHDEAIKELFKEYNKADKKQRFRYIFIYNVFCLLE